MDAPQPRNSLVLLVLFIPPALLTCLAFLTLAGSNSLVRLADEPLETTPTVTVDSADLALAHYQQGIAYHVQKRYSQAESAYKAALKADPTLGEVYNALGNLYLDLDRPYAALQMFSQAVHTEPEVAEWWRNLGVVQANEGYLIEAAAALEQAVSLDPGNLALRDELNLIYTKLGRE